MVLLTFIAIAQLVVLALLLQRVIQETGNRGSSETLAEQAVQRIERQTLHRLFQAASMPESGGDDYS